MASILKTDKIEGVTASGTVQMPAGHVIQTQTLSRVRTGKTESSSTSAIILNDGVGNFELAITPKFSTSKIIGLSLIHI